MNRLAFLSFLLISVLFTGATNAQTGWKWAINSVNTSSSYDFVQMSLDKSGNLVSCGINAQGPSSVSFGSVVLNNPASLNQLVVTKNDSTGNFLWAIGTGNTDAFPISITTDTLGNTYLLGMYDSSLCTFGPVTLSNPNKYCMYFMARITPEGTVSWAENISGQAPDNFYLQLYGNIGVDDSLNIYVTGLFESDTITIGYINLINADTFGYSDIFLAKFNSSGTTMWAEKFGGPNSDYITSASISSHGDIFLMGNCGSPLGTQFGTYTISNTSDFLARINNAGNVVWAENLTEGLSTTYLTTDFKNNSYVTGNITSSLTVGADYLINSGVENVFVAKYNPSGTVIWARSGGGSNADYADYVSVDGCGNVWIAGSMWSKSFGPSTPGYTMTFGSHTLAEPLNSYDPAFAAGYDSLGNYISSLSLTGGGDDFTSLVVDRSGDFYIASDYLTKNIIFGTDTMVATWAEQLYIGKYEYENSTCSVLESQVITTPPGISVYPNPAFDAITITSGSQFASGAIVAIYDLTGRLIVKYPLSGSQTIVPVSDCKAGLYECRVYSGEYITTEKLTILK